MVFVFVKLLFVRPRRRKRHKNPWPISDETWGLREKDTFSNEWFDFGERFSSEEDARTAAREILNEHEIDQPTESSGGQDGIQDQVWIVRPDMSIYRYIIED